MIFEWEGFYVDLIKDEDLNDVMEVYNSNKDFLLSHMNTDKIDYKWIINELNTMKEANFKSCKIIEKSSDKLIGIIDYKNGQETYLSLLMLHNNYKNKGYGKIIYNKFEQYIKSLNSSGIRIDVVINYDNNVLNFWTKNGFKKIKDIKLNWTGKVLSAVEMKKNL
ncbi:GNAT family N-acetyltransferase [Dethiothermospora halolimnae]|uniref:GNAT family N-acetyltransferase n=1 Tax=Dethiothermospora halolimnae TaxID=3114390 RepID=UPI003CCB8DCC